MNRRGISPLLAVIITIAIVIAVGGFVFAWSYGLVRMGSTIADITITDIRLIQTALGDSTFSITVKNTGTVTILSVTVYAPTGVTLDNSNKITFGKKLAPGKTASKIATVSGVDVGKSYIFRVIVNFADGSHKELPISVICEQV